MVKCVENGQPGQKLERFEVSEESNKLQIHKYPQFLTRLTDFNTFYHFPTLYLISNSFGLIKFSKVKILLDGGFCDFWWLFSQKAKIQMT